jgi:hypothetical protein
VRRSSSVRLLSLRNPLKSPHPEETRKRLLDG